MNPDTKRTDVFIHLPTRGFVSLREIKLALERIVEGVPTWSDVRMVREALDTIADRSYEN